MRCPLCSTSAITPYFTDKKRPYLQCSECDLVFVHPDFLPSAHTEKSEYDKHENSFDDDGYKQFLRKLVNPLLSLINTGETALDFGCGPAAVLAKMLKDEGLNVDIYDPFYAPFEEVLNRSFDVITCTEAIEHFHHPAKEWSILTSMLNPSGILAIMTKRVIDKERFATWHYKNDPTHVSFFSERTFSYLARRDGFDIKFPSSDVVLMRKL
ncbi:class I SAM-dependent methyltransferase [Alteromonas sp.]|uniref:class I SAM-dependent methyltransferase n=1 Tax=Alteromonas sp. TaxID=232 RepID=UPI000B6F79C3|nr:class I SAM-dependent methyltransferase [Alteromonas sp.]MAI39071.1 methyltransferase [Alteromonas sp.]|tara:strand:- start:12824 stop:13456 length:633 start_codon:yes stop_codon:yes gene_type:complete